GIVAEQTWPGVLPQLSRTVVAKTDRMRIGSAARREQRARASPADARSRVTDGAVSLGVTAHARVQVALRFPGVVHGRAGWVGPEPPGAARVRVGRVKAAAPGKRR